MPRRQTSTLGCVVELLQRCLNSTRSFSRHLSGTRRSAGGREWEFQEFESPNIWRSTTSRRQLTVLKNSSCKIQSFRVAKLRRAIVALRLWPEDPAPLSEQTLPPPEELLRYAVAAIFRCAMQRSRQARC